ncbi:FMN-linked oxidoreductase [Auriscalpium vulgare]|uniref:FMN-linked oxidoreductase n=1 Tax=Auriscalpium vulgare TaxID=40419 RepID=A0ACB8RN17_9AGAM|nr:FMN-linked oxidoreductase [Auriscalpium vulgare]
MPHGSSILTGGLEEVFRPVTLPSGAVLPNRLVKVAMYEHLAALFGGPPTPSHLSLYAQWAGGGWGMIVTGNIQISADHLTLGRDMVIPETVTRESLRPFVALAQAMKAPRNITVGQDASDTEPFSGHPSVLMQLSHAGRQSPSFIGGRLPFIPSLAPSPIRVGSSASSAKPRDGWLSNIIWRALFPIPRPMTVVDIQRVVDRFVEGARVALEAGFDGVQIHASHGYLIAQFISPKTNERDDAYNVRDAPLRLLHEVVIAIRSAVPSSFILGVKVNSADYFGAGGRFVFDGDAEDASEKSALDHVIEMASWGLLDFIEISGGDYESPDFGATDRQAFFSRFSRKALAAIKSLPSSSPRHRPLVVLTGGLQTPANLTDALSNGHADLLGIGRGSVLCPDLPRRLQKCISESLHQESPSTDRSMPLEDTVADAFPGPPDLAVRESRTTRVAFSLLTTLGVLPLPKLIGAGAGMAWYTVMMSRLAKGRPIDYKIGAAGGIVRMWAAEVQIVSVALIVIILYTAWTMTFFS